MPLVLTSPDFTHQGSIPQQYTCQGRDVSPPLSWSGAPEGTKSFVLDPGRPRRARPGGPEADVGALGALQHPRRRERPERGRRRSARAASRARARARTTGTAPATAGRARPIGRHRYFHKLYALDAELPDLGAARKAEVEKAMEGHVLAKTELIGTYQKR